MKSIQPKQLENNQSVHLDINQSAELPEGVVSTRRNSNPNLLIIKNT